MKRVIIFFLIAMAFGLLRSWAAPVDESVAAQRASQFLTHRLAVGPMRVAPVTSPLRLLLAQAKGDAMTLLTHDSKFSFYDEPYVCLV